MQSTGGSREVLESFEREARAAGSLNHPNLLTLFDVGTHEGSPYLVTELLHGMSGVLHRDLFKSDIKKPRTNGRLYRTSACDPGG